MHSQSPALQAGRVLQSAATVQSPTGDAVSTHAPLMQAHPAGHCSAK